MFSSIGIEIPVLIVVANINEKNITKSFYALQRKFPSVISDCQKYRKYVAGTKLSPVETDLNLFLTKTQIKLQNILKQVNNNYL